MSRFCRLRLSAFLICVLSGTSAAWAQTIIGPSGATTNMGIADGTYPITSIIDQSGLSSHYTSGVTDFATYTASAKHSLGGFDSNQWYSSLNNTSGNVDLDLGGTHTIDALALWNGNTTGGVKGFTLLAANDSTFASATTLGTYTANQVSAPVSAQTFNFAATSAAFVRIQIHSNYGFTYTAIGEVAFEELAAVPEPSSLILGSLAGLAGVGRWTRQKKQTRGI